MLNTESEILYSSVPIDAYHLTNCRRQHNNVGQYDMI